MDEGDFHIRRDWLDCDQCGKPNPSRRCTRCKTVLYCGSDCQKQHWPQHRPYCIPLEEMHRRAEGVGEALPKSPDESHSDPCGICLSDEIVQPLVLPDCGHVFCFSCLKQYQEYLALGEQLSCPYCRKEVPSSVEEAIVERARLYAARAGREDLSEEQRQECYKSAMEELDQLPEGSEGGGLFTRAEIYLGIGQPKLALECLQRLVKIAKETSERVDQAQELVNQSEKATTDEEAEKLQQEAMDLVRVPGSVLLRGEGEAQYFLIYLKMAEAKQAMEDWEGALDIYIKKMLSAMSSPTDGTPPEHRAMWMGMSRCFYELGHYEKAIDSGKAAIEMNQNFPGVHEYVALSQQASGDVESAKKTMMRAIVYESPWDERHTSSLKRLYRSTFDKTVESNE